MPLALQLLNVEGPRKDDFKFVDADGFTKVIVGTLSYRFHPVPLFVLSRNDKHFNERIHFEHFR